MLVFFNAAQILECRQYDPISDENGIIMYG
jgi:hypothetical protein